MEVSHLKMNDRYLPYVLESLSANVQNIHMVSDHLLWLLNSQLHGSYRSIASSFSRYRIHGSHVHLHCYPSALPHFLEIPADTFPDLTDMSLLWQVFPVSRPEPDAVLRILKFPSFVILTVDNSMKKSETAGFFIRLSTILKQICYFLTRKMQYIRSLWMIFLYRSFSLCFIHRNFLKDQQIAQEL